MDTQSDDAISAMLNYLDISDTRPTAEVEDGFALQAVPSLSANNTVDSRDVGESRLTSPPEVSSRLQPTKESISQFAADLHRQSPVPHRLLTRVEIAKDLHL
jgi:hypothetical protein